ncbi:MAG TPA: hypothetical protein VFG68_07970 [Fimbriiglobus sp.]|nr:hypothetical protein [Fimbriiglobus sp.]
MPDRCIRVTRARPCPICHKPDWCLIREDGSGAICTRTKSDKCCGDAGWLHRLAEPVRVPTGPKPAPARPAADIAAEARRCADRMKPDDRALLADWLRLPVDALAILPLLGFRPDDRNGPCFTFPECDATGALIGMTRRYADGAKSAIHGSRRGLTLPDGWRDRPGPVFVVEGASDTLAMTRAGLACVGRPSNTGGAAMLADLFRELPPDRPVVVVGENDSKPHGAWPGRDGARHVAAELARRLGRPVSWALPPADAKDARDWLTADARGRAGWPARGKELREKLTGAAVAVAPSPELTRGAGAGPSVPVIVTGTDEYRVNAEAAAALGSGPDVYCRGGVLVEVVAPDAPGADPIVRELSPPLLRERLSRCARWVTVDTRGEHPSHPRDWCVSALHSNGRREGVRRLEAVVTYPVFVPDGSVLCRNGYDRASGLLVSMPPELSVRVPDRPSKRDAAAAVRVVLDVVSDFPFVTMADRSAWLATLLTPFARPAFVGPAPWFLNDGNVRGIGKGLLMSVTAIILTGQPFAATAYPAEREELRKLITTAALHCDRFLFFDNLSGPVGNATLDAALTTDRWNDRLLGGNRRYDGPLRMTWYATGNNVQLQRDTPRRVCRIRMESAAERPEERTDFRYPDLLAHVGRERGQLLSAALTVLRAWHAAGRPTHGLPGWGSYEGWSAVVREALVYAGLPDPGETRPRLRADTDRDAAVMLAVFAGLDQLDPRGRGLTAAEIIGRVDRLPAKAPRWRADLRAAVDELCDGGPDSARLGFQFRHFRGRNFGGRMLDVASAPQGINRWVVRAVPAGGYGPDRE